MPTYTVSGFISYVRNSDNFVGRRELVDRIRFRPGTRGEYLSLKMAHEPLYL